MPGQIPRLTVAGPRQTLPGPGRPCRAPAARFDLAQRRLTLSWNVRLAARARQGCFLPGPQPQRGAQRQTDETWKTRLATRSDPLLATFLLGDLREGNAMEPWKGGLALTCRQARSLAYQLPGPKPCRAPADLAGPRQTKLGSL